MWRHRIQTDMDIRHLLWDKPNHKGKNAENSHSVAAKHLELLSKAVLEGDDLRAEHLAAALAERYGF
jgi:hypothetical protein